MLASRPVRIGERHHGVARRNHKPCVEVGLRVRVRVDEQLEDDPAATTRLLCDVDDMPRGDITLRHVDEVRDDQLFLGGNCLECKQAAFRKPAQRGDVATAACHDNSGAGGFSDGLGTINTVNFRLSSVLF